MRNHSLSTIVSNPVMAQRSSSGSHQLLIADDYDFDRVRSTESTENALTIGKVSNGGLPTLQASPSFDDEDRGVPITPKKLPMTPPRDHGSPYRPNNHTEYLQQPIFGGIPEDSTSLTRQPFLRPATNTWRHKEEDIHGGASIFRSSYEFDDVLSSRGHESFYTIQRSMAFDEDDDDMEVGGGYCCSS